MINILGISSGPSIGGLTPRYAGRSGLTMPVVPAAAEAPVKFSIIAAPNDTINIGSSSALGPQGIPGPPGPAGSVGPVNVVTVTGSLYVATTSNYFIGVSGGSETNIVLPVSITGTMYVVKDMAGNASIDNITISALGPKRIDGAFTSVIRTNFGAITLIYANGQWNLI